MNHFFNIKTKLEQFTKRYYLSALLKGALLFFGIGLLYALFWISIEYFFWISSSGRTIVFWSLVFFEMILFYKLLCVPLLKYLKIRSRVKFNGCCDDFEKSTYTLVNVCLPVSADKVPLFLFQLDLKGIACSKGSACQSGSDKGSHVLTEILSEDDLKKPSIRFSFSSYNTKEELDNVVDVIKNLVFETA